MFSLQSVLLIFKLKRVIQYRNRPRVKVCFKQFKNNPNNRNRNYYFSLANSIICTNYLKLINPINDLDKEGISNKFQLIN